MWPSVTVANIHFLWFWAHCSVVSPPGMTAGGNRREHCTGPGQRAQCSSWAAWRLDSLQSRWAELQSVVQMLKHYNPGAYNIKTLQILVQKTTAGKHHPTNPQTNTKSLRPHGQMLYCLFLPSAVCPAPVQTPTELQFWMRGEASSWVPQSLPGKSSSTHFWFQVGVS